MNFMRGRTFLNKYVIIDEAQNLTPKQMKTLITRAGPGTKIICMGNLAQIDTPYLTEGSSGLTYAVDKLQGLAAQRAHHPGTRRALAPGRLCQRSALNLHDTQSWRGLKPGFDLQIGLRSRRSCRWPGSRTW
jgi:hypothetical protein